MIIITIEVPDGTEISISKDAEVTLSDGTNTITGVRGMVIIDANEPITYNTPVTIAPVPEPPPAP